MQRFSPLCRRVLAVAASTVIGLIGAMALASPASAHHSEVEGDPSCDTGTGEWVVEWTVNSFAPDGVESYRLIDVKVKPAEHEVSNIAVTPESEYPHDVGTPLTGEQRIPGDTTSASLWVKAEWENGQVEKEFQKSQVEFDSPCEVPVEPERAQVSPASTCEELLVTITNPEGGKDEVTATFTPNTGDEQTVTLSPDKAETVAFPGSEGLTAAVVIDGEPYDVYAWEPEDCEVDVPVAWLADCDVLTVEVTNPLEDEAIEVTVTNSDVTEALNIEPGESEEVTFDAEEVAVATVTLGESSLDIPWEEPEDCDEPEPAAPGEGGGLPVMAQTGIAAGAALALLALGSLARHRRIHLHRLIPPVLRGRNYQGSRRWVR